MLDRSRFRIIRAIVFSALLLVASTPRRPPLLFTSRSSATAPARPSPASTSRYGRRSRRRIPPSSSPSVTPFRVLTIRPPKPSGVRFAARCNPSAAFPSTSRPAITTSGRPNPSGCSRRYAGHPAHYGFDYARPISPCSIIAGPTKCPPPKSRSSKTDLKTHAAQPLKFVVSHRPSWLFNVALGNSNFALHQLARKYGVQYVIAGHVHQMLHAELDGVTYVSMPSSGGHLRASRAYEDGWFFACALVSIDGPSIGFQIQELGPPHGEARTTKLSDWGLTGLIQRVQPQPAAAH